MSQADDASYQLTFPSPCHMVAMQPNCIYNKSIQIEFDAAKSALNVRRRGLPFDLVASFDFDSAVIKPDTRRDYGEVRYQAFGLIDGRLYFVAFSLRADSVRIISLRKANAREVRFYEQETRPRAD